MPTETMLTNLLLGGLLGLIGQGVRLVIGLKKLREEASTAAQVSLPSLDSQLTDSPAPSAKALYNDAFDGRRLWVSLLIGIIAGCLSMLTRGSQATGTITNDVVLALLAAGYAGTDFIEGIFKKFLPGS